MRTCQALLILTALAAVTPGVAAQIAGSKIPVGADAGRPTTAAIMTTTPPTTGPTTVPAGAAASAAPSVPTLAGDDFAPAPLLIVLLVVVVCVVLVVAAAAVLGAIAVVAGGALLALGIVSSSAVFGLARQSAGDGARAAVIQALAAAGLPFGVAGIWGMSRALHLGWGTGAVLGVGAACGLAGGVAGGIALNAVFGRIVRLAAARLQSRRGQAGGNRPGFPVAPTVAPADGASR